MLNSMRKSVSSWPIKILLGLMVLSFGLWGIGDIFVSRGNQNILAKINKTEIEEADFFKAYIFNLNQLSQQIGKKITPKEGESLGLVKSTLNILVADSIFYEETKSLKLRVSDDTLRNAIFNAPAFKDNTGNFNKFAFERYLNMSGQSEETALEKIRQDLAKEQIFSSITNEAKLPDSISKVLFEYRNEKRSAQILILKNNSIEISESISNESLNKFYLSNINNYYAPEYITVSIVNISPKEISKELSVSDKEAKITYEQRIGEFAVPEIRDVTQLLYVNKINADKALNLLLNNSNNIEKISKKTNAINLGATNIGKIKWNDLPIEIANPTFELLENEWSEPFETSLGWHIVKVNKIIKQSTKSFDEVKNQIKFSMKENKAADIVFELANKLEDELAAESTLETAAKNIGLSARNFQKIDKNGLNNNNKANLPSPEKLLPIIFSSKIDQVSSPIDTDEGGLLFLRVDFITESRPKPLNEIKEIVEKDLKKDRRTKKLTDIGKKLADEINNGESLENVATKLKIKINNATSFKRTDGSEQSSILSNKIVRLLFSSNVGEITSSSLPNGNFVIAKLISVEKTPQNNNNIDYIRLKQSINNSFYSDIKEQYRNALAKKFGVKIFQENFNSLDVSQAFNSR